MNHIEVEHEGKIYGAYPADLTVGEMDAIRDDIRDARDEVYTLQEKVWVHNDLSEQYARKFVTNITVDGESVTIDQVPQKVLLSMAQHAQDFLTDRLPLRKKPSRKGTRRKAG